MQEQNGRKKHKRRKLDVKADATKDAMSGWQLSGDGLGHKDAVLPPARRRISRQFLDKEAVAKAASVPIVPYLSKISDGEATGSTSGLVKACLRAVASKIGEEAVLDELSQVDVPSHLVKQLVYRVQQVYGDDLPFSVWKRICQTQQDVSTSFKCFKGIVFDDEAQLQSLNIFESYNNFLPPHIVTFLDLSNTAFTPEDMYKIRTRLAATLVALRLDNVSLLDDNSITILARDVGETADVFERLSILSLHGCRKITDRSIDKLAKFPSLQMIDLRDTSCVEARNILRQATPHSPPFFPAFMDSHRSLFVDEALDTIYLRLRQIALAPLVKADSPEVLQMLPNESIPPSILITELTRLDETRLHDPRLPVQHNPFTASHHAFGKVYTTAPIAANLLREDGNEQAGGFEASKSVLQAELSMSRIDATWRKKKASKKRKNGGVVPAKKQASGSSEVRESEQQDVDYDSDIAVEEHRETTIDIPVGIDLEARHLPIFYGITPLDKDDPAAPPLPDKHPLMLLRFFKAGETSVGYSTKNKRAAEFDDRVPVTLKKKPVKGDFVLSDLLGVRPASKLLRCAVTPSPSLASPPSSASSLKSLRRPPGVVVRR